MSFPTLVFGLAQRLRLPTSWRPRPSRPTTYRRRAPIELLFAAVPYEGPPPSSIGLPSAPGTCQQLRERFAPVASSSTSPVLPGYIRLELRKTTLLMRSGTNIKLCPKGIQRHLDTITAFGVVVSIMSPCYRHK